MGGDGESLRVAVAGPERLIVDAIAHGLASLGCRAAPLPAGALDDWALDVGALDDWALDDGARAGSLGGADLVVLDVRPDDEGTGPRWVRTLVAAGARVLVVSSSRHRLLLAECLEAGAAGVFLTDLPLEELVENLHAAAAGVTRLSALGRDELLADLRHQRAVRASLTELFDQLTETEAGVLADLMDGKAAEVIAGERYIAVSTVRSHIRAVLVKLGVNSQLAAVAIARRAGWSLASIA